MAVTEDDQYGELKRALCSETGTAYVVLPKTPPKFKPGLDHRNRAVDPRPQGSATQGRFCRRVAGCAALFPARRLHRNCAISPLVSISSWDYEKRSGLGGSAAWALLNGEDGVDSELNLGVGWQDPAVITETGLCVWKSGLRPTLHLKRRRRNAQWADGTPVYRQRT